MYATKYDIRKMASLLKSHKILALPTESVYGISAIVREGTAKRISIIKKRVPGKGFIILSGDISHLLRFIDVRYLSNSNLTELGKRYEKARTWIVPAKPNIKWLTGSFSNIAVRLTKNPLLNLLTREVGEAIISTSANISNMPETTSYMEVYKRFNKHVDYIYPEHNFVSSKPSQLINLLTGEVIRS